AAMTVPALAADYGEWGDGYDTEFRASYGVEPGDWAGFGDDDDPVSFETGIRYWYALGQQSFTSSSGTVSSEDAAHIGELHLRIEDDWTNTFATAIGGYSMALSGEVSSPSGTAPI